MLPAERISQIIKIISRDGTVQIDELAAKFNVSEMTIRRDLKKCQELGILDRCYGGGVVKKELLPERDVNERLIQNMPIKDELANLCMDYVHANDVVFIDAGTTMRCIARRIATVAGVRVVTNDINVAHELLNSGCNDIYMLGGPIQTSSGAVIGEVVTRAINRMRFNVAFLGAAAINNDYYIMTSTQEKVYLKRAVCNSANSSFLVVDDSKFNIQSMYQSIALSEFTGVITNMVFSENEKKIIMSKRINIIQPERR